VPIEEHLALVAVGLLWLADGARRIRARWPSSRPAMALPVVAAAGLLVVLLGAAMRGPIAITAAGTDARLLLLARSFYGAYRVLETAPDRHVLYSGTTIHGIQDLSAARRTEPQSYYNRAGPLGQVLEALEAGGSPLRIGAVGLGAGAAAADGRPGDHITFGEIDPTVVALARDSGLFTFLTDSRADVTVQVGDGRLGLAAAAPGTFDVIVLDAFSSDAVPVHLLTVEAVELALSRTTAHGILAFHVSNRYLDLEPVVASAARALGVVSITGSHLPPADELGLVNASQWVIVARTYADVAGLAEGVEWATGRTDDRRPWTDRQSDLLSALE
jgi:hypothetical protein